MSGSVKGIGIISSILLFLVPGIVFWIHLNWTVPFLAHVWPLSMYATWIIVGSFFLFLPLFALTFLLLKRDGYGLDRYTVFARLHLRRMNRGDWAWVFGGLLVAIVLSGVIMLVLTLLPLGFRISDLKQVSPIEASVLIGPERLFFLLLPVLLFFNYVGEEILWRGYILPRQEVSIGKYAWIMNGVLHLIFHWGFGLTAMIISIPILFSIPFVAHKTKNTNTAIVMHALIGAPVQIMAALGIIS